MSMSVTIAEELFDQIIDHFSHNADNIHKVLDKFNVSKHAFYKALDSDQHKSERYAQARTLYVENRLSERDRLNEELLLKIQSCDPKLANALQNAYKEQIRQIEWDVQKLIPKKYGDKIDVTSNGETLATSTALSQARKRVQTSNNSTAPSTVESQAID